MRIGILRVSLQQRWIKNHCQINPVQDMFLCGHTHIHGGFWGEEETEKEKEREREKGRGLGGGGERGRESEIYRARTLR